MDNIVKQAKTIVNHPNKEKWDEWFKKEGLNVLEMEEDPAGFKAIEKNISDTLAKTYHNTWKDIMTNYENELGAARAKAPNELTEEEKEMVALE